MEDGENATIPEKLDEICSVLDEIKEALVNLTTTLATRA
jgi:hypothetical protein